MIEPMAINVIIQSFYKYCLSFWPVWSQCFTYMGTGQIILIKNMPNSFCVGEGGGGLPSKYFNTRFAMLLDNAVLTRLKQTFWRKNNTNYFLKIRKYVSKKIKKQGKWNKICFTMINPWYNFCYNWNLL